MKYCNKCKVQVDMPKGKCPLCFATLKNTDAPSELSPFPSLNNDLKKHHSIFRLVLFFSVAISIICLVINYMYPTPIAWAVIVTGCLGFGTVMTYMSLKKMYTNIGLYTIIQGIIICLLCILIDGYTYKTGWPVNYVIPGISIVVNLVLLFISYLHRSSYKRYIIYQILANILGFLPLLLFFLGIMDYMLLAVLPALCSVIILLGTFIFRSKETRAEIKKRFHY